MKLISTLFDSAFLLATSKAFFETSIAVTFACDKFAFKAIGIHPVPVPMSKMVMSDGFWVMGEFKIHSTNSSVSGLGIKVFSLTSNRKP